jgi:hypothetical protein
VVQGLFIVNTVIVEGNAFSSHVSGIALEQLGLMLVHFRIVLAIPQMNIACRCILSTVLKIRLKSIVRE